MEIEYKQFIVIPRKPKMSSGKMVSQGCHASYMALEQQRKTNPKIIKEWEKEGQCVIVLECPSQIQLMNLAKYCEQWNVDCWNYIDEGLTEIPCGTNSCFATGVLPAKDHWMFSTLKLFTDKKPKESLLERWKKIM